VPGWVIFLLRYSVALLASILVVGIATHAWRQRSFGIACLAAWMATLSLSAWAMVLSISPDGRLTAFGLLFSAPLTMLAGPLLLGYVTYAVRGVRLHWAWFLPFAVHLVATLVLGMELYRVFGMMRVILLEFIFTLIAWIVFLRGAKPPGSQPAVIGVLAAVTALHLGQAAGILDVLGIIDYRPIRQAPLIIVCIWMGAVLAIGLLDSPLLRKLAPALAAPASDADRALYASIERQMVEERPWREPDFDVGALARRLGTYPNAVSRALSRAGDVTFYDYVNRHRVREAERLLSDPSEARIKIEALGRQAGFRARSTFFKLFRQHTGQTPSEYRAARNRHAQA
jgi:AraC-like DNA-binding protein